MIRGRPTLDWKAATVATTKKGNPLASRVTFAMICGYKIVKGEHGRCSLTVGVRRNHYFFLSLVDKGILQQTKLEAENKTGSAGAESLEL